MILPGGPKLLSKPYLQFCTFETIGINSVGLGTLVFQDQLRESCPYPGLYQFWFTPPIPASETEHLMCSMIAGWLMVAAVLQAFINFDDKVPVRTKFAALYTFGLCDWIWMILIVQHFSLISIYHVIGSVFIVYQRLQYMIEPKKILKD